MSREGSVAPKERINIRYKSATSADEDVELPLTILVTGDLTGKPDPSPLGDRKPKKIDKNTFNEILAGYDLGLSISVEDRLKGEEDAEIPVSLKFSSLGDFHPEAIVKQVPQLRKLLELREALQALRGPLGNIPDFRRQLQNLLKSAEGRRKILEDLGASKVAGSQGNGE